MNAICWWFFLFFLFYWPSNWKTSSKFFFTFWTTVAPQSLSSDMVPIGISSSWTPSFVVIVRIYWAALITFSIPLERKYTRLISTWSSYCFALILWYWNHKDLFLSLVILCKLGVSGFFRLQGIKVLWGLQFLEYLRTLSFKFLKARTKIEVVLSLPCWLFQFSSQFWSKPSEILDLRSSNTPDTVTLTIPWYLEV